MTMIERVGCDQKSVRFRVILQMRWVLTHTRITVYSNQVLTTKPMKIEIISEKQRENRKYWIDKISRLSGDFGVDVEQVEAHLGREIKEDGIDSLLGHLRLCGTIPEGYDHDSSEEKLYSKYTDVVIHEAYSHMGFDSLVLKGRAAVADVECVSNEYSFVADAKAFRLSRTAKNQKDFKVQAMDDWKHGKPYAMVVCPVYQVPFHTIPVKFINRPEHGRFVLEHIHISRFSFAMLN